RVCRVRLRSTGQQPGGDVAAGRRSLCVHARTGCKTASEQLVQFLSVLGQAMTWARSTPLLQSGVLLIAAGAAFAQALSVERLQRLLQGVPRTEVRFTETRESRWLGAPNRAVGTQ